ncbi:MAG: LL-diaminopimelate aminotransferase [Candidatus Magnetomorum sp.]|nr:LL-diaminopimelate aminotransferase [Candidatus Magnetomorum sp.]
MISLNMNYQKLNASYLFSEIAHRVNTYQHNHPDKKIIKLGIGDVTEPLPPACIKALHKACDEMGSRDTFKGYGPEQGYSFLREIIAEKDFKARGANISPDDIFISDGAKCDTGSFQELFNPSITVAVPDPVYPVYVDTNVMAGRTGLYNKGRYQNLVYLECTSENNFIPELPKKQLDLIYLCYPNNPTGATITKAELEQWVRYAEKQKSLILFDAAYEAFIQDPDLPRSIYEIPGAEKVAVEFRSFSKTAGFTGLRCAYTVVPEGCLVYDHMEAPFTLRGFWNRRQTTRFNGVSYPVQCAAHAVYTDEGQEQVKLLISYYLKNAAVIREALTSMGFDCTGGENSPYIWVDTKRDSWEFFDLLLEKAAVACTPGSGFGRCGEGFIRISAFNQYENVLEAIDRITTLKL